MIKPILSKALMVLGLLLYACQVPSKEGKAVPKPKKPWEKGNSIAYNQEINEREQLKIAAFLDHRKDFKMSLTPSGLRYYIYKKGPINQPLLKAEDIALVSIKIQEMEAGVVCYETEDGLDEIKVDRNDYESGLNEALKLMRKGDRAKLILPNHLAHGLVGDLDKIPPLSILLLDVSLEDIIYTSK